MSKQAKGNIQITDAALASLIGLTAHEVPGVVGMAPINLKEGIAKALGRSQVKDGVQIHRGKREKAHADKARTDKAGGKAEAADAPYWAELSIIIAYGLSIPTVAENIEERVMHVTKQYAGIRLEEVRVNVVGVSRE